MYPGAYITYLLLLANLVVSYQGLRYTSFFDRYSFRVDEILAGKQYIRLISSGFLHISWGHFIFNMLALLAFGSMLEMSVGHLQFIIIYAGGLLAGDAVALFVHRQHGDYSAAGASGAVAGIIFATIALFPGMAIGMFFIPIAIPGWLWGLVYVLYSIWGIQTGVENKGHNAHLGGALGGMLVALLLHPGVITENIITILIISVPAIVYIIIIMRKPHVLIVDNVFAKKEQRTTIDERYNIARSQKQQDIDAILDKINRKGIDSLTKLERQKLDEYSNSQR